MIEEVCPECGWKFKSELLGGDALATLREHRRLQHSIPAILVGNEAEQQRALNEGWDQLDIILPDTRYLQGRRWHVLYITWGFLFTDMASDLRDEMLAIIHSNQVMMHGEVHIVMSPPSRKDIK